MYTKYKIISPLWFSVLPSLPRSQSEGFLARFKRTCISQGSNQDISSPNQGAVTPNMECNPRPITPNTTPFHSPDEEDEDFLVMMDNNLKS